MPFKDALMIPGVIPWCLNFGCVKSLYYGLSMWLPFFLNKRLSHKSLTGILAASLNVGAIIGSFVCGYLGDYMKYRSPIIALFLTCSLPCLLMMEVGNDSIFWIYFLIIPLTGFFIAGPANIISTAVAADLSQNPAVGANMEAMATVAGLIDGAGGIAASIATFTMGAISSYDWLYVFLLMVFLAICSVASIFQITLRDFKMYRKNKKNQTMPGHKKSLISPDFN